jgi:hypothetical protein
MIFLLKKRTVFIYLSFLLSAFFLVSFSKKFFTFWFPYDLSFRKEDFVIRSQGTDKILILKGAKLDKLQRLRNRIVNIHFSDTDSPVIQGMLVDASFDKILIFSIDGKVLTFYYKDIARIQSDFESTSKR